MFMTYLEFANYIRNAALIKKAANAAGGSFLKLPEEFANSPQGTAFRALMGGGVGEVMFPGGKSSPQHQKLRNALLNLASSAAFGAGGRYLLDTYYRRLKQQ